MISRGLATYWGWELWSLCLSFCSGRWDRETVRRASIMLKTQQLCFGKIKCSNEAEEA